MLAATYEESAVLKTLLRAKANVHKADQAGRTPIMAAAAFGRDDNVELLLEAGARVLQRRQDGWSAKMFAIRFGHEDVLDELEDFDATEADVSFLKEARLLAGARMGDEDIVDDMLDDGADLEAVWFQDGMTSLMSAARAMEPDALERILEEKPQIDATDDNGWTALMHAAAAGREQQATPSDVGIKLPSTLARENYRSAPWLILIGKEK